MKRWDWTWDDAEHGPGAPDPGPSLQPPLWLTPTEAPDPGRNRRIRRRRTAAGLGAVGLVALLITAVTTGSAHPRHVVHRRLLAPPPTPTARRAQALAAEQRALDSAVVSTPVVVRGGHHVREVALTFDDGPGPYTPKVVATLHRLHAPATFFAVGRMERYFAQGTLDEIRFGNAVGDHTENHKFLGRLSPHDQRQEIVDQSQDLAALGIQYPRLFRPPYASYNDVTLRELRELDMVMVLWSTDTGDFRLPGADVIAHRALAGAHPGAIILLHDGGGNRAQTIAALPAIVRGLRRRRLRPVTVPRLLLDDPPRAGQPIPTSLRGD